MDKTAVVAAALELSVFAPASEAVTNIRHERWQTFHRNLGRDTVAPVDTASGVSFTFNATVTAADLVNGLRFSLAEKDVATRDVLMRFTLALCNELPPVGADVLITTAGGLYCDASGKLRAKNFVHWTATWCDVPVQGVCGGNTTAAAIRLRRCHRSVIRKTSN